MSALTCKRDRKHNLAKMSLAELVRAFSIYPSVLVYLGVAALSFYLAYRWYQTPLPLVVAWALTGLAYPLVWYALHRWVLHGRILFRSPLTAALWKRIHFDHHQDPHNLEVLFGALYTTLPTIAIVAIPIGYVVGGPAGSATAFGAGVITTLFYEFCHCMQHLNTSPRTRFMHRVKRQHLAHHFHNEQGNYGITNFFWDRLFGTYYAKAKMVPRSPTVFNLGYTEEMARRYPWVQELSKDDSDDGALGIFGPKQLQTKGHQPAPPPA